VSDVVSKAMDSASAPTQLDLVGLRGLLARSLLCVVTGSTVTRHEVTEMNDDQETPGVLDETWRQHMVLQQPQKHPQRPKK